MRKRDKESVEVVESETSAPAESTPAEAQPPLFLNEAERVLYEQQQQAAAGAPALEDAMLQHAEHVQHVRVSGPPETGYAPGSGVRVQQFTGGVTQHKRVTAIDPMPAAVPPDHKPVPNAVLAEVRQILDSNGGPLSAADALRAVRDLLTPWL